MPWGPSDAELKDKKANTPGKKKQWSAVANSVLARSGDEGRAVKTANGILKRASERR